MPDRTIKIIRNSKGTLCRNCNGLHEFLSRPSAHAKCGTPVAFSASKAPKIARLLAGGEKDILDVPGDTVVILDDSARKLPREGTTAMLDQDVETIVRA